MAWLPLPSERRHTVVHTVTWSDMNLDQRVFFRDRLRQSRSAVLEDSENFLAVAHEIERLGRYLYTGKQNGLGAYWADIRELAGCSPLAEKIPSDWPQCHIEVEALYKLHQLARNDAAHEGAAARSAAAHAVPLALALEDALMDGLDRVGHFMVREPVCAALWQPISFVRQTLLANSFSYLPVWDGNPVNARWGLVSDFAVASYLRMANGKDDRRARLAKPLSEALHADAGIQLLYPHQCLLYETVDHALNASMGLPVLVVAENDSVLLGIATPFDLL